ncbi:hypothetical protein [Intestinimonas butyriciproducens]|uniref:rolling circle replication-associated protein n=1 Tax=Intestinimonas butyriciproducens TaxID=1297617 RepID=UPI00189B2B14|nr:hypothetical protein [Intestinimonas butyriciproducens]MDB7829614.1 hypothetical protein [Intestinimonas butyriciproducens]
MYYNVRVKSYPDGTKQYMYSERMKEKGYKVEKKENTGQEVERKERDNMTRAVQKVYDLARSNVFDWFITMTFDPEKVDRYDYDACADAIKGFTHKLCLNGNQWIIVPEQHKDGAYHFHGLVSGDLDLTYHADGVYNLNDYGYGFTTATKIRDRARVSTYIAKYLTKLITVPKGRKRYWASRSLQRPSEDLVVMSSEEYGEIYNSARFQKVIDSSFGSFIMCEVGGEGATGLENSK